MTRADHPARRAFEPSVLAQIEALLAAAWVSRGDGNAAPSQRRSDGSATPGIEDHALTIAGMLAAGGTKAEVAEYIRSAEESQFGASRSAGRDVNALARHAWVLVRGAADDAEAAE